MKYAWKDRTSGTIYEWKSERGQQKTLFERKHKVLRALEDIEHTGNIVFGVIRHRRFKKLFVRGF